MAAAPHPSGLPGSVLLAGGGTAGHVSPLLALAEHLREQRPDIRIRVLGTAEGLESRLVPERGLELVVVPKVPMPRRPSVVAARFPQLLAVAVNVATRAIRENDAEVVVGFGGYVATPAYLAARRTRTPIVVHEQNARAGIANRLGARLTRHVGVTFASTDLRCGTRVGMPLRREIADLDRPARRPEAIEHFGLEPDRPTLLVTGGSLGAQRLNEAFAGAAADLTAAGIQVLHLTGAGKEVVPPEDTPGDARYVVRAYTDRMDLAYAAADLVVGRAGANTVCELTAVGLPAIYVPLPIGNGEQRLNAADVVAAGGGRLVEDALVTPDWVRSAVVPLLLDREATTDMARRAAAMGERHGDARLADLVRAAVR